MPALGVNKEGIRRRSQNNKKSVERVTNGSITIEAASSMRWQQWRPTTEAAEDRLLGTMKIAAFSPNSVRNAVGDKAVVFGKPYEIGWLDFLGQPAQGRQAAETVRENE